MKKIIKPLVSLVILYFIARTIQLNRLLDTICHANLILLVLAVLLQFASTLISSYRWFLIMRSLDFGGSPRFYMESYFRGAFFNQGLPTSIGGDAIRVLDVASRGHRKRNAFCGVFVDRMTGLLGLLLLNLFANFQEAKILPHRLFLLLNAVVGAGLVLFLMALFLRKLPRLRQFRSVALFYEISDRLNAVLNSVTKASVQISLSLVIHLLGMFCIFLIGLSLGLHYDFTIFLAIVPSVILLTMIPISFAGWGVREGGMVGLFTLVGADKSLIVSMSLLYGFILIVSSLTGLYYYIRTSDRMAR